jgi:hypothetical protein
VRGELAATLDQNFDRTERATDRAIQDPTRRRRNQNLAGKSESRNSKSETIDEKSKQPKKKTGLLSV